MRHKFFPCNLKKNRFAKSQNPKTTIGSGLQLHACVPLKRLAGPINHSYIVQLMPLNNCLYTNIKWSIIYKLDDNKKPEIKKVNVCLPTCVAPQMESLQQSRGQLLKVSEQISSTMRSTQESLTSKLQQSQSRAQQAEAQLEQTQRELDRSRNQVTRLQTQWEETQAQLLQTRSQLEQSRLLLEQVRAQNLLLHSRLEQVSAELGEARVQSGQLQTQLQASERSVEASSESLLLKVGSCVSNQGLHPLKPALEGLLRHSTAQRLIPIH